MKLFKTAFYILVMFFPVSEVIAEGTWTTYTNPNKINDFAVHGNDLWCATPGGLLRYDIRDKSYVKYVTTDGLPDNDVLSVTVDKNGIVWCYCQGLLGRYDGATWQAHKLKSPENYRFYKMTVSDDNTVWLVSSKGQIELFDGESMVAYNDDLVDDFTSVSGIQVSSKNDIWVVSSKYGVAHFDGALWTYYDESGDLGTSGVYGIAQDSHGLLWISTNRGIASFNGSIWTTYYDNVPLCGSMSIDTENTIWVGSQHELWRFDKTTWTQFINFEEQNFQTDILYNTVHSIVVDKENVKWIKTYFPPIGIGDWAEQEVVSFSGSNWQQYTKWKYEPAQHNWLYDIFVFDDNKKWFHTSKGIMQYDGNSWEKVNFDVTVDDYELYYRGTDKNNNTWFTYNGSKGLMCYDGTNISLYPLEKRNLIDFYVDENNIIWIATYDYDKFAGIASFDGEKWVQHTLNNEQTGLLNIYAEDKLHRMWFGIPGTFSYRLGEYENAGGMLSFDGTTFKRYTVADGLPSNAVQTIAVDSDNTLWIGTDKGLTRYDGHTWTTYTQRDGLADDIVHSIAIDLDGIIWIGTECGLSRFDPGTVTFVDAEDSKLSPIKILGSYPNPFNSSTTIEFSLPENGMASLDIYSITGQRIRTLVSETMSAGTHSVLWDGKNDCGTTVSSGMYLTHLVAGQYTANHRLMLIK